MIGGGESFSQGWTKGWGLGRQVTQNASKTRTTANSEGTQTGTTSVEGGSKSSTSTTSTGSSGGTQRSVGGGTSQTDGTGSSSGVSGLDFKGTRTSSSNSSKSSTDSSNWSDVKSDGWSKSTTDSEMKGTNWSSSKNESSNRSTTKSLSEVIGKSGMESSNVSGNLSRNDQVNYVDQSGRTTTRSNAESDSISWRVQYPKVAATVKSFISQIDRLYNPYDPCVFIIHRDLDPSLMQGIEGAKRVLKLSCSTMEVSIPIMEGDTAKNVFERIRTKGGEGFEALTRGMDVKSWEELDSFLEKSHFQVELLEE